MIGPQTQQGTKRTLPAAVISQLTKKRKQQQASSSSNGSSTSSSTSSSNGGSSRIYLEKIMGLTTDSNTKISVHSQTQYIAYCAANLVVCYNHRKNKQFQFLQNQSSNKTFSCVQFSKNGKMLAAGERGAKPSIVLWDVLSGKKVIEIKKDNHLYGVTCLAFSHDAKYLVSVGDENDGTIKLWDLSSNNNTSSMANVSMSSTNSSNLSTLSSNRGTLIQTTKNIRKASDVAFSPDNNFYVVVGDKFIKYHHLEQNTNGNIEIKSSACILGNFKDSNFVSVDIVKTKEGVNIYAVNSAGILCMLNENRQIVKWLDLKVKAAHSISVNDDIICCGCSNGTVRLFEPSTLKFKCTLPKPPQVAGMTTSNNDPNCVACRLLDSRQVVTIYSDRSFYIWDISNMQRIAKYRSFLSHSDSIWDIDLLPVSQNTSALPYGSFVTCSSDNTVRVWNVEASSSLHVSEKIERGESFISKNVFCKDLLHVIEDKPSNSSGEQGIRSVKFSPDGEYIACGNRQGEVKLFRSSDFGNIFSEIAHEAEILSLDFSFNPNDPTDILFATSSRDRLIHVFQQKGTTYKLVTSLDDHTASVTSVKFTRDENHNRYLISCSADKSIVFRKIEVDGNGDYTFKRYQNSQTAFGTIFDLDINEANDIVTVGQDKKINVWELEKCKAKQSYKVDTKTISESYTPSSEPLRVSYDHSGEFVVVSSADKYIRLYNLSSGECIARVCGHSEIITGVKFSRDCRKIISVSGDGCIFVWKLSPNVTKLLTKNKPVEVPPTIPQTKSILSQPAPNMGILTRDTLLPLWVKQKGRKTMTTTTLENIDLGETKPIATSKWSERVEMGKPFKLASMDDETSSNDDEDVTEEVMYFNSEQSPDFLVSATSKDKMVIDSEEEEKEEEKTGPIPTIEVQKEDFLSKNYESLSKPFDPTALCDTARISVTSQFLRKAIGKKTPQGKTVLPKKNPIPNGTPSEPSQQPTIPTIPDRPTVEKAPVQPIQPVQPPSSNNTSFSASKFALNDSLISQNSDVPLPIVLSLNQISHSFSHAMTIIDQMDQESEQATKAKESLAKLLHNMNNSFSTKVYQLNTSSTQDILEKYSTMMFDMVKQKLEGKKK